MNIPAQFGNSKALQYIVSKGWNYKVIDSEQIELEFCPFCNKGNYGHFYANCVGKKDGLYKCQRCGTSGNLTTLKESQGDKIQNVMGANDFSKAGDYIEPLPDIDEIHQALLEDEDTLDYLQNVRGFSRSIIEKTKLGVTRRHFKNLGEVKALVYPYFAQDNCVFVHYRTLPKADKAFNSPKGWDAPLYNSDVLQEGLKELILVEGEANTIAALDKGVTGVAGVPGANFKKALWIEKLDQINPEKIYICYDKDSTGQKAAQTLASRVGIERCYKLLLPDFKWVDDDGLEKIGKDINEWFVYGGGTLEAFNELKEQAQLFDVQGVSSSLDALSALEEFLNNKSSLEPTYKTPWPSLNNIVGFEDGDVIDIIAPEKTGKTTIGMNLVEYAVNTYGEDGIIICLEMSTVRLVRKWVSHITRTRDVIPKNAEEASVLLTTFKSAILQARTISSERKGDLYFCYPQIKDVDDVYKLIKDCIRRYGVKWVMFDNLQLLCDRTLKNNNHRTIHLSQISKNMAALAKDYGIKLIRILQPHRIGDGKIISTDDVDGSSQVAKDCDVMITAHRNPMIQLTQADFNKVGVVNQEQTFDSKMLLTVGLTRYSAGGMITLEFDGATSSINEFDVAKMLEDAAKPSPTSFETQAKNMLGDVPV